MSTRDETEKCLLCRVVDLHTVAVRYWLNKSVPILLTFYYIVSVAVKDVLRESIGLAVCMWIVRRRRRVRSFE